jgi:glutaredoxin-related protein
MRHVLAPEMIHPAIQPKVSDLNRALVEEVMAAVASEGIVVVGMGQNPHCAKIRKALDAAGVHYRYMEYGNYLNNWRRRTAFKMWTGWPTLPMVFAGGFLVGGASDAIALLSTGELQRLAASRSLG